MSWPSLPYSALDIESVPGSVPPMAFLRRSATLVLAILFSALAPAAPRAQTADTTFYAVSYIEVGPDGEKAAISLLKLYREAVVTEERHISLDVFEQIDRPGHFVLVEAWKDPQAFEAHGTMKHTKELTEKLQPLRNSPVDQRPYKALSIVSKSASATRQTIYVVTHVDTIPTPGSDGPGMLRKLAESSRTEEGNIRFDVWQHTMRANHFTVVEAWRNQKALDAHAAAAHTKAYREAVAPLAGSPLDERLYKAVE